MKKTLYLAGIALIAMLSLTFTSCSSDDDNAPDTTVSKVTVRYQFVIDEITLKYCNVYMEWIDNKGEKAYGQIVAPNTVQPVDYTKWPFTAQVNYLITLKEGVTEETITEQSIHTTTTRRCLYGRYNAQGELIGNEETSATASFGSTRSKKMFVKHFGEGQLITETYEITF